MGAKRLNSSFLAKSEQALLVAIAQRLPASVAPDHLTALGLAGAVIAAASFILSNWCSVLLLGAIFGLFLNWFGDSLDGTLARHRRIERPLSGFFIDHSTDLIATSFIVLGLGASPYFTLDSALFVLSLYLLMSSYTYLKVAVEGVHLLSYGGLGATEFRILIALWSLFAEFSGDRLISAQIMGFIGVDLVVGALSAGTFVLFMCMVSRDLAQIEPKTIEIYSSKRRHRAKRRSLVTIVTNSDTRLKEGNSING